VKEWNEHIEEYLNGELTASDAKAFEKNSLPIQIYKQN